MAKEKNSHQWQHAVERKTENSIKRVLMDGKPHLYGILLQETHLSKATLSKHLKIMQKNRVIGRKEDTTKKYPYPVSYLLLNEDEEFKRIYEKVKSLAQVADDNFRQTKTPELYFATLNQMTNKMLLSMVGVVRSLEKDASFLDKEFQDEVSNYFDFFVMWPFETISQHFLATAQEIGFDPKQSIDQEVK